MRSKILVLSAAAMAATWTLTASAHHSFSMFDMDSKVTIQGKVAEFQWTNPHVWLEVDVTEDNGEVTRWGVEFTSRVHLTRQGFPVGMLNPGDEVTVVLSPYRNGEPGGRFYTVEKANGEAFRDPSAQREFERSQGIGRGRGPAPQ